MATLGFTDVSEVRLNSALQQPEQVIKKIVGAPPLEGQVLQNRFESSNQWLQQPSSYEYRTEIRPLHLSSGPSHFLEQNEELVSCEL